MHTPPPRPAPPNQKNKISRSLEVSIPACSHMWFRNMDLQVNQSQSQNFVHAYMYPICVKYANIYLPTIINNQTGDDFNINKLMNL